MTLTKFKNFSENALSAKWFRLAVTVLLSLIFYIVIMRMDQITLEDPKAYIIGIFFTLVFFAAVLIFSMDMKNDLILLGFFAALVGCLVVVRAALLWFPSSDYNYFLVHWCAQLREAPGLTGLSADIGDYNMPYLYILFIISKLDFSDLYMIKFVSIGFDLMIAYYAMKLVSLKTDSKYIKMVSFLAAFGAPTVILNSAMWGQCDGVFTAFCLGAVYYCLKGKSIHAYAFLALALSFKLQAIFIVPFFIAYVILKKLSLKHCWIAFAVFFATLVPALAAGKPFLDTISIYYEQATQYPALTMNAPSLWALIGGVDSNHFNVAATFLAGFAVCSLLLFIYVHKDYKWTTKDFVLLAFIFSLLVPYVLPKMHERYFFMADVFAVVYMFYDRKRWYYPVGVIFSSYVSYQVVILNSELFFELKYLSLILLVIVCLALRDFIKQVRYSPANVAISTKSKL